MTSITYCQDFIKGFLYAFKNIFIFASPQAVKIRAKNTTVYKMPDCIATLCDKNLKKLKFLLANGDKTFTLVVISDIILVKRRQEV